MTAKELIKSRNLKFLHPDIVASADNENISSIIKAVGYFRNFAIFKVLYTLLYKSKDLSLEQYRDMYEMIADYKKTHPKDYFLDGFSMALSKSSVNKSVKSIYAIMIYNQFYRNSSLFKSRPRLEKAIYNYYNNDRAINFAIIRDSKVLKINNRNLVKSIVKWIH